ncbi:MAG: hypothetical protein NVS4B11_19960 [Ktedonobacteraceae bacterium]
MPSDSSLFTSDQERFRLQQALRESEILRELSELLASSLDLTHILQVLVKRTTEVCEVERCAVWLFEETRDLFIPKTYFLSAHHLNQNDVKVGDHIWYRSSLPSQNSVIQHLTMENGMIVIEDLRTEPSMKAFAEKFLVRSILFIALRREGRVVGMMSLDNPGNVGPFSSEQQQLACAIGQQAAVAIDNARLYQQVQSENKRAERLIRRAQSIYEVALAVNSNEDLSTVLGIATQHLVSSLDADGGSIVLLDNGALILASTTNLQSPASTVSPPLVDLPHCCEALREETPLFFTQDTIVEIEKEWYQQLGLSNVMIVPLIAGAKNGSKRKKKNALLLEEKHCVGFAFVNYHRVTRQPSKGHCAFAQDIAAQCALAIEKNQLLTSANQIAALATERANTLDAVFNAMTEGVVVLDQEGQIIVNNQTASHFLGRQLHAKEHLATFLQLYPTHTQYGQPIAYEDFPLARALQGERIRGERFVTRRADNSERTIEINIAPLHDDESRRIGIVSAFRDVTEQVRVEQRIRGALDVMLNAAEALAGVTDIKEMIQRVLTMTLNALHCERGFVHLYDEERQLFIPLLSIGCSEEADAYWNNEQQYWFAPDVPRAREPYASLVAGHTTLISPEHRTFHEETTLVDTVLVAPLTHDKRLLGVMVLDRATLQKEKDEVQHIAPPHTRYARREFTVWDVTVVEGIAQFAGLAIEQARWQSEATTARTNEAEMRESNALKDEFLSITAHEFRSPLTIILAHSQMMERIMRRIPEMPKRAKLQESITIIEEQTHQLTNIVNTFLEVTHLNKGQVVLKQEKVDLGELLKQEVITYSATTPLHSIHYAMKSDKQAYCVMGDNARLQQIFGNLLQNAIKYSPRGGPITVSLKRYVDEAGKVFTEVRVADKGIGIPTDAQPHLFERFYRAPNVDGSKGVGLGLYVVAEFLHLHGGTIHVESSGNYGEGSCFVVTLPLLESDCTPVG